MASDIFELIGLMLGAAHGYADGIVEISDGRSAARHERFWQARGRRWRVERDDGPLVVSDQDAGYSLRASRRGGPQKRGPALRDGSFAADVLLRPRLGLIWGRSGEDWRLAGTLEDLSATEVRLDLRHSASRSEGGHLILHPQLGFLHELVLGERSMRLLNLNLGSPVGLPPDAFSSLC